MIGNKTSQELQQIAARGGSFEVDGTKFPAVELENIARRLKAGASLKIFNSDTIGEMECQIIASQACDEATVIFA